MEDTEDAEDEEDMKGTEIIEDVEETEDLEDTGNTEDTEGIQDTKETEDTQHTEDTEDAVSPHRHCGVTQRGAACGRNHQRRIADGQRVDTPQPGRALSSRDVQR